MTLSKASLDQAWIDFKRTGDLETRNQIALHYRDLVKSVANKLGNTLPAMVDREDLMSYGTFGLLDAIEKFDLTKGVKFETYAATRIRGSIVDEIRALDWVPRSIRSKARDIEKARTEVEAALGRPPEHAEVAQYLGLEMSEYWQFASQANAPSSVHYSLDGHQGDSVDGFAIEVPDPTSNPIELFESDEVHSLIGEAVSNMDERSKTVLVLYYLHEMTLAEIGKILGVTESRVCQLQSKALGALQSFLGRGGLAA